MRENAVHIVQLPFPRLRSPHDHVASYYRDYALAYSRYIEDYFIPEGSLWELPLWVAHLSGMLDHLDLPSTFVDLTQTHATVDTCTAALLDSTCPGDALFFSPLAQNFDVAVGTSRRLMQEGRRVILGGNMAGMAGEADATSIHRGQATPQSLHDCLGGECRVVTNRIKRGEVASWLPNYRLLEPYRGKVPLLRLNASHGCLYACDFCGDAWSRSLTVVPQAVLEHEIRQFEELFPATRLIYIGDKTFGQSKAAVRNLLEVFAGRPKYAFIVQTHVLAIDDALVDAMERLGVVAVELGFESASIDLLREHHKGNRTLEFFQERMMRLRRRGIRVLLNVLSGLPTETEAAHAQTVRFIESAGTDVWLYNLYNFVPYPLTPLFPRLKSRIVDWEFSHWVEDGPPVFQPYHVSRDESFGFFLDKVAAAHRAIRRQLVSEPEPIGRRRAPEPVGGEAR